MKRGAFPQRLYAFFEEEDFHLLPFLLIFYGLSQLPNPLLSLPQALLILSVFQLQLLLLVHRNISALLGAAVLLLEQDLALSKKRHLALAISKRTTVSALLQLVASKRA